MSGAHFDAWVSKAHFIALLRTAYFSKSVIAFFDREHLFNRDHENDYSCFCTRNWKKSGERNLKWIYFTLWIYFYVCFLNGFEMLGDNGEGVLFAFKLLELTHGQVLYGFLLNFVLVKESLSTSPFRLNTFKKNPSQ